MKLESWRKKNQKRVNFKNQKEQTWHKKKTKRESLKVGGWDCGSGKHNGGRGKEKTKRKNNRGGKEVCKMALGLKTSKKSNTEKKK